MMTLNQTYFAKISTKTYDSLEFTGYLSKGTGNTMVLFGNDSTPILAIHFAPQNTEKDESAKCAIAERKTDQEGQQLFQGLINKDNESIMLVLTNLTDDFLRVEISPYNNKDKKHGKNLVNKINALRPFETIEVKSDNNNNDKTLILSAIKKSDGQNLTVKDDEKHEEQQGTYFSLMAFPPKTNRKVCDLFENTYWRTTNKIVTKTETKTPNFHEEDIFSSPTYRGFTNNKNNSVYDDYLLFEDAPVYRGFHTSPHVTETPIIDNDTILNSSSAKIIHGDKIDVQVQQQNIDFQETGSISCVIGLSVQEALKFSDGQTIKSLEEEIQNDIDVMINNQKANHIIGSDNMKNTKKFVSAMCSICLDGTPDTTFYNCGHCVTHQKCSEKLTTCPICRSYINARLTEINTNSSSSTSSSK